LWENVRSESATARLNIVACDWYTSELRKVDFSVTVGNVVIYPFHTEVQL